MPLVSPPHSQACWWGRGLGSEQLDALRKGQHSLNLSAAASCRNHSTEENGLQHPPLPPCPATAQAEERTALLGLAIKENNNALKASSPGSLTPHFIGCSSPHSHSPASKNESVSSHHPRLEEIPKVGVMITRTQILMNH